MARRGFDFVLLPAQPPTRVALFAIRVVDAATLETIRRGLTVTAVGLRDDPIVNGSGLFVWLDEELAALERVEVDPGDLPFEAVVLGREGLRLPPDAPPHLTTIELPPRPDYPFPEGIAGLRGRLFESGSVDPEGRTPAPGAGVNLQWRDDETGVWVDAPTASRTDARGEFAAILRVGRGRTPARDPSGRYDVRLRARRDASLPRTSLPFPLAPGRVADPTADAPLTFFWDEFQP